MKLFYAYLYLPIQNRKSRAARPNLKQNWQSAKNAFHKQMYSRGMFNIESSHRTFCQVHVDVNSKQQILYVKNGVYSEIKI